MKRYLKLPLSPVTADAVNDALQIWAPPPNLTVSEWADRNRVLSAEDSAEAGRWRTSRAEYQRGIMDAYNDPAVEEIVWVACSQVGKTQVVNNIVGYVIDQDPGPVLVVQPRVEDAESWSKERLAPMLRDNEWARGKVADPKSRNSGNTILHKLFPGGHLSAVGANAPAGLAARPIRVVLADEVDRYPASAGTEGDPVSLARRRTETFWNRKIVLISTPTIAGLSRIWTAFEESDQRRFWVPCPHCGEYQILVWGQVKWQKGRPETAEYACAHCGGLWDDAARWRAVSQGEWRAGAPFRGVAGFHVNALYSPFVRLADKAREWLEVHDRPERLKVFVNTVLGECFQEKGEAPEWRRLYERREGWDLGLAPQGVLFLTAGVDVQKDRIEVYVWGWGRDRESWMVDHRVISGDTGRSETFDELSAVLNDVWPHESGAMLPLTRLAIDSGYATTEVYAWARRVGDRRVLVVKGQDRGGAIIGVPSRVDVNVKGRRMKRGVQVWPVGVSIIKAETYGWLRLEKPTEESGDPFPPGYIHLPRIDEHRIRQLVAEELVTRATRNGFRRTEWVKVEDRNEALDCRVYARAAAHQAGLDHMTERHWEKLEAQLGLQPAPRGGDDTGEKNEAPAKEAAPRGSRGAAAGARLSQLFGD